MTSDQPRDGLPRVFTRFWWGETASGFGTAVTVLALPTLVVLTLGGGAVEVGWLNAARWLPYLVLGVLVGALVDRVRRRPVLIATDLTRAVLLALVPACWAFGILTLPVLLGIVVVFGTASLVNDAASQSFVPRLVPRGVLQRAHARLDGAAAVAQLSGTAVAGALVRLFGAPLAVLVDAVTYLVSVATMASLGNVDEPRRERVARLDLRGLLVEVREGVGWVYRRSGLARLAVATHVWFAAQAALLVVTTPYALVPLGLSPFQLGLALGGGGVGGFLGALLSTRAGSRVGTGGAVIAARALSATGALVVLGAVAVNRGWPAAAVLGAGQLCLGVGIGISNSHEMSYRQALTPDALQARTNTTMRSLNRAVVVVVSPLAGLSAERLGFGWTIAGAAVVFAGSALLLLASPFRSARIT